MLRGESYIKSYVFIKLALISAPKAKLTFLWYDNFGKNKGLCIGMAWLPFQKVSFLIRQDLIKFESFWS